MNLKHINIDILCDFLNNEININPLVNSKSNKSKLNWNISVKFMNKNIIIPNYNYNFFNIIKKIK